MELQLQTGAEKTTLAFVVFTFVPEVQSFYFIAVPIGQLICFYVNYEMVYLPDM